MVAVHRCSCLRLQGGDTRRGLVSAVACGRVPGRAGRRHVISFLGIAGGADLCGSAPVALFAVPVRCQPTAEFSTPIPQT